MRWSLKLSEMDFTVERKAGTKIAHVDALSRHVGVFMNEESLSREEILRYQASDDFCQKTAAGDLFRQAWIFPWWWGLHIYRWHYVVVPRSLIPQVIKEYHDPLYIAHPEIKRTPFHFLELWVACYATIHWRLHKEMWPLPKAEGRSGIYSPTGWYGGARNPLPDYIHRQ